MAHFGGLELAKCIDVDMGDTTFDGDGLFDYDLIVLLGSQALEAILTFPQVNLSSSKTTSSFSTVSSSSLPSSHSLLSSMSSKDIESQQIPGKKVNPYKIISNAAVSWAFLYQLWSQHKVFHLILIPPWILRL